MNFKEYCGRQTQCDMELTISGAEIRIEMVTVQPLAELLLEMIR